MEHIGSKQNSLIQHLKKLQTSRSYRYRCGEFVADGTKLLDEAVRWYSGLLAVVVREGVSVSVPQSVRTITVPDSLMAYLSSMETPQGALFLCKMSQQPPLAVAEGCLILDGIQDPGNLGTILRTADALEVPVILTEGCADPYGEKTVRASMGAVFRTQPQQATREAVLNLCKAEAIPIGVTELTEDAVDIRQAALSKMALVVGSEGQGVCREYREAASHRLVIPMQARCESLNAAVAATIVMWQMKR